MGSEPPEIGDRVRAAEVVVASALAAFEAQEWETVTALTDADSIETLRREYLDEKARRFAVPPPTWGSTDPGQEELNELLAQMADLPITFHELAGVATLEHGSIARRRAEGKLGNLASKLGMEPLDGKIGIAQVGSRGIFSSLPSKTIGQYMPRSIST